MESRHWKEDRKRRANAIAQIGEGNVVFSCVKFDRKRNRSYKYEITDNGILIVKSLDRKDFIVTKMIARPSRILQYWEDAPQNIIMIAVNHTRQGLVF